MSRNIKNDETRRPAGELARLTRETMTERLERERHERDVEGRIQKMRATAARCARLLAPGPSAVEHGDMLYDERGVPR